MKNEGKSLSMLEGQAYQRYGNRPFESLSGQGENLVQYFHQINAITNP